MKHSSSNREVATLAAQLQEVRDPAALRQAAQRLGEIGESRACHQLSQMTIAAR